MEPQIFVQGYRVNDRRGRLPTRAGAEPYTTRPPTAITHAVIHYSGVDADSTALAIAQYQVTKAEGDPFPAIAYHFIVRQSGEIEQCHDLVVRTWHAGPLANQTGVAICLPMLHGPTPLQADATGRLIAALGDRLQRILTVAGHKDLYPSQCPGEGWPAWKKQVGPHSGHAVREIVVAGVPIKWAFFDAYKKLETAHPGMLGRPLGPHRALGGGDAVQEFAGCTMLWSEGRLWVAFKGEIRCCRT